MLQKDGFDANEALDILVSFSISEEGSNNMFIQLIQVMLTKRNPEGYNLVECEIILNHFPHQIWRTEDDMKPLRDQFYMPVFDQIETHINEINNRQFISIFQGLTLCGSKILPQNLLNSFLNQYVKRIQPTDKKYLALKQSEVYQFLELFVQYISYN